MTLKSPYNLPGPGIRPYQYQVIINGTPAPGEPANLIQLNSVTLSYDPRECRATMRMWDRESVMAHASMSSQAMPTPRIGDAIEIKVQWDRDSENRVVFRGKIDGISDNMTPDGKVYNVSVMMDSQRLNEEHVTLTANTVNDPINNPTPNFDPNTGERVDMRRLTIYEIVQRIMNFRSAWGHDSYFTFADIEWGDLDTNKACGLFVPSNIALNDTPKAEAIRDVLKKAGSYELHYDPAPAPRGRFRVVQLSLDAKRCGDLWDLRFPPEGGSTSTGSGIDYAINLDIKQDSTEWSSRQSANVCRVTSGPIRWYSGNYTIPEMIENTFTLHPDTGEHVPVPEEERLRQLGTDTVAMQKARAINFEGVLYRFADPQNLFADTRKYPQYPVGMPLFPDWNIFEDWMPEVVSIAAVANLPAGKTDKDYEWQAAYEPMSKGHMRAMGIRRFDMADNLQVYQAWYVSGPCPACEGTGTVMSIYNGDGPTIVWQAWGHDSRRKVPVVTNYKWNPNRFGEPNPNNSTYGFQKWVPTESQPYPIPWLNTCPCCRGVGSKPEYKIRNIQRDLIAGTTQKDALKAGTDKEDVKIDPEYTQAGPETWQESQARLIKQFSAYVQVESYFGHYRLPTKRVNADLDWLSLLFLNENDRAIKFPHPLTAFKQPLATMLGLTGDAANLIPSAWKDKCKAPFTTILFDDQYQPYIDTKTGRVIFQSPIFIAGEVEASTIKRYYRNGKVAIKLASNGLPDISASQLGNPQKDRSGRPMGYWRPARAWLQCFWIKDDWYHQPDHDPVAFTYTDPDGNTNTYLAKCMVVDGRWCVEVAKRDPATWDDQDVEFNNHDRVVQVTITDHEAIVETTESDFQIMPIPPAADLSPDELEEIKNDAELRFPRAHLFRWERPTAGEVLYEMEMAGSTDSQAMVAQAMRRPRLYSWRLRDDRSKLMALAVRRLEAANDLLVSGNLRITGRTIDLAGGLGHVQYPNRGKAAVVKVTHSFDQGFETTLELTRPEARFGEMPPDDAITLSDLRKEFLTWRETERKRGIKNQGDEPTHYAANKDFGVDNRPGGPASQV